ncbi:MAG TPA: hypothetical protein DCX37_03390 [Firmicutes bacterium]|jgi:predicted amidohydrolase|nr:hypothetical protein [Bacillota bacterium]HAW70213.1 hypothetical protein [Bacillota bacterium]HBL50130.1 hypothetical protein [Bacillota bacterium]HBL68569.1 hypothetical protein [Bacillota bacterium]HBR23197.1 hypothetical protein [Bacillota bacterium]
MLRAAVVQLSAFNIQQSAQALEHAVAMVHQAAEQKPDLVLLPECTYPSYYLGDQNAPGTTQDELDYVMNAFAELARKYRFHLAVGLPERASGRLYNSAFLFGPQGAVIGKVRKSFLWHFDAHWFSGGGEFPVFDTALGKIGMLICADARLPEIARMLKLGGAEIILDPTNWVSSGGERTKLTNPQFEFMVQTRALENKVWFLAANKIGLERRSILFCGRSCVIAPSGERVLEASADREEILICEIDLGKSAEDEIVPGFSCIKDRRPETYGLLAAINAGQQEQRFTAAASISPWLAACVQSVGAGAAESDGAEIISVLGAQLAVFSSLDSMKANGITDPGYYAADKGIALAAAQEGSAKLFLPDGRCETYHKMHGRTNKRVPDKVHDGGEEPPKPGTNQVFQTPLGKVAFILDEEGLIPEPARIAALQGAELIIWISSELYPLHEKLARTRAAENCCYLAVCFPAERYARSGNMLIAPNGTVMATALPGESQIITGMINPVLAQSKLIVPRTDVVAGRIPEKYKLLVTCDK